MRSSSYAIEWSVLRHLIRWKNVSLSWVEDISALGDIDDACLKERFIHDWLVIL
ncbi:hypothetical protein Plhal304r1_c006g0023901 [Plasmopara halstedii]